MGRDYGEVVNGHTKEIVNCIEMHTTCGYCKLINKMWSPPASSLDVCLSAPTYVKSRLAVAPAM